MNRREFCAATLAATFGGPAGIIDTHIHLFDPARPQGVPWPKPEDTAIYRTTLPARFRQVAAPHGVVGAIAIECSPWVEDNQWLLDCAARDTAILGVIGSLDPADGAFAKHLDRFRANPLYLGIRCGNLWSRSLAAGIANPDYMARLGLLSNAGLTMDIANPEAALMDAVMRVADRWPELRIVLDHMPRFDAPAKTFRELATRPRIWAKISAVPRRVDGAVPTPLDFYRARLDAIFDAFGPERVLYGSDWPNSDRTATYAQGFAIVDEYFTQKGGSAAAKYFRENSKAAYRWRER